MTACRPSVLLPFSNLTDPTPKAVCALLIGLTFSGWLVESETVHYVRVSRGAEWREMDRGHFVALYVRPK